MMYFAYGSNMNRGKIEKRVHRSSLGGVAARLSGFKLRFNKRSIDKSGKANIVADREGEVWGVLFGLSDVEIESLAEYEGGYSRTYVDVGSVKTSESIHVLTFVASGDEPDILPTRQYLGIILQGACEHGLPDEYCKKLAITKTRA
jgi:cation transport regulator ChaC